MDEDCKLTSVIIDPDGALAEQLRGTLQKFIDGCDSRTCLQMIIYLVVYTIGFVKKYAFCGSLRIVCDIFQFRLI